MILDQYWYKKDTVTLAKEILGKYLVHERDEGITVGKIVETEAYIFGDPANHAFSRKTNRNKAMFGPSGHAYIYHIYGMYYLFNVTSGEEGVGEAVLLRALEPVIGIELMKERRENKLKAIKSSDLHLCSGPGKLVLAMGVTKSLYGHDLTLKPLYLSTGEEFNLPEIYVRDENIIKTTRIGINEGKDLPLRFYIKGNKFISKK